MYYRSQGYPYKKEVNIPPNYGGNAFLDKTNELSEQTEEANQEIPPQDTLTQETPCDSYEDKSPRTDAVAEAGIFKQGSFLGGKIGSEELLLLAIIFLISDSEGSDDILWLLVLLLFIK